MDESGRQYIHLVVDGAERLKILISDLLQFSRAGTSKEEFKLIDLNQTLIRVLDILGPQIRESRVKLHISMLPQITADESQMCQLFENLIGNALKYRKEANPGIELGYLEKETEWELFVKDNGIGFDRNNAEKIFVIFQRLHSKNEYSGTGIGLAICKKIVERHGGRIWVDSIPGTGSTFYFTVPKSN